MSAPTKDPPPVLTFHDLYLTFSKRDGSDLHVLSGIDLEINDGEFVCVVGPSGCGKSTLLRLADGLLFPTSGLAALQGHRVQSPSSATAMVFQDDRLLPWRTVLRNVLLPLELQNALSTTNRQFADQLLEVVGLDEFSGAYPGELSGGMRQRVNLARGLVSDPDVLLLDEPFSALDAQTREVMQEELLRVWRTFRKTVLFITHQIDEAIYLADRVIVMSPRPSRILDTIEIDYPRPRALDIKRESRFGGYVDRVWRQVMTDANE